MCNICIIIKQAAQLANVVLMCRVVICGRSSTSQRTGVHEVARGNGNAVQLAFITRFRMGHAAVIKESQN